VSSHADWVRQIDAELDGELTLAERATLARHLAGCPACAGARASHLELRVALARSAGEPNARAVPRPRIRARSVAVWIAVSVLLGAVGGWLAREGWSWTPGALEGARAAFVVE
jgi:anti-sigma factor RsiW